MKIIQSKVHVDGITGKDIFNFLINPTDSDYRRWWKGTHLQLHTVKRCANDIGNVVYFDEFIGEHRVKMTGVIVEAVPGKKIVWQLKKGIRLPAWLCMEFEDDAEGVTITHSIRAGFEGVGRLFDPIIDLAVSEEFRKALDEHVKTEFPKLRDMLRGTAPDSPTSS